MEYKHKYNDLERNINVEATLFNYTQQHMHLYIYILFKKSKSYIKYLKRSYMFRSHDHPQGAYIVPC